MLDKMVCESWCKVLCCTSPDGFGESHWKLHGQRRAVKDSHRSDQARGSVSVGQQMVGGN